MILIHDWNRRIFVNLYLIDGPVFEFLFLLLKIDSFGSMKVVVFKMVFVLWFLFHLMAQIVTFVGCQTATFAYNGAYALRFVFIFIFFVIVFVLIKFEFLFLLENCEFPVNTQGNRSSLVIKQLKLWLRLLSFDKRLLFGHKVLIFNQA